jgi:hypothetical protein
MTVTDAINTAERLLPGIPAPEGEVDERWQAILKVRAFIKTEPEHVWTFVDRWGRSDEKDLRTAIATCLLEHVLEHWFDRFFPRVELAVRSDIRFADTFSRCWQFGEAEELGNAERFKTLHDEAALLWRSRLPRQR